MNLMAVTPEAAGSSPVDPATNYLQFRHFHTSVNLNATASGEMPEVVDRDAHVSLPSHDRPRICRHISLLQ